MILNKTSDLWNFWICVERDMNVKLDIQPNLWQYWISTTVERDENVKRDQTIVQLNLWQCWINSGTVEYKRLDWN